MCIHPFRREGVGRALIKVLAFCVFVVGSRLGLAWTGEAGEGFIVVVQRRRNMEVSEEQYILLAKT